jgi:hypothetical protein
MDQPTMPQRSHAERVDADAVCGNCGSVNPEDTLICKMCGNNLRDQRAARMATDQLQEETSSTRQRRAVLSGVLAVVGLLMVAWVALNSDMIAQGMVSSVGGQDGFSLGLWSGVDGARLDTLVEQLRTSPPSLEAQLEAIRSPIRLADPEGVYVIARESVAEGIRPVGTAVVAREDDILYFAGLVDIMEVRGRGRVNAEGMLVVDWAGYREGASEYEVRGAAAPSADGGLECYGELTLATGDSSREAYTFFAYPVVGAPAF